LVRWHYFLISIERIDDALKLTQANLEWNQNRYPADISRCHRCLAAIERIKKNHNEAETHLQKAIEIARKIGVPDIEIEVLLGFSRLDLDRERYKDAIHKANETLKIVDRTGFRLYEPEAELILAKVYLAQGDKTQAKSYASSALAKAKEMSYKLIENEINAFLDKTNL